MDILSDVIAAVRTGRPGGARVDWHAPWGRRFPDQPGAAGFLVVLQGTCWLLREAGSPLQLGPGDVLFSPRGDGYTLADTPQSPVIPAAFPDGRREVHGTPSANDEGGAPPPGPPNTGCGF
jgi:hypothetical protein